MSQEPELEALSAVWTAPGGENGGGIGLKSGSGRFRAFRIRRLLELAFAGVLMAFAISHMYAHPGLETFLWAAAVCVTTLGATAFQLWNWRGSWKSSSKSVADYTDLYERRCRAMLRAVHFGNRFLALQLAIATPWLTFDFVRGQASAHRYAMGLSLLGLLTVAFLFSFRRSRRRALRELVEVQEFRRKLVE
jgi:hypothetical protein